MGNLEMIISTECCDKAKKHKVVYLDFPRDAGDDGFPYKDFKPIWVIKFEVEVSFCPFCKKDVPDLEINVDAIKEDIHEGDGYYCEVCDERSGCCQCLPPTFRWKPIGSTIKLPIRERLSDDEDDDEDE